MHLLLGFAREEMAVGTRSRLHWRLALECGRVRCDCRLVSRERRLRHGLRLDS